MDTDYISPSGYRLSRCLCKCDCGNTVTVNMASLVTGKTSSCGCIQNSRGLLKDNKELVEKYDFEKNTIAPDEISCFSGIKVWWKCTEGHSWKVIVSNRVNGSGCPRCNIENVNSFYEQTVYYYVKKAFSDAINSDMHINMELDIYIPSIKTAIEYDGEAWHSSVKKQETDITKNKKCIEAGITMIRIREPRLDTITD